MATNNDFITVPGFDGGRRAAGILMRRSNVGPTCDIKCAPRVAGSAKDAAAALMNTAAANDNDFQKVRAEFLKSGDELPDGTIYLGKVNGEHYATTPRLLLRAVEHYALIDKKRDGSGTGKDLTHKIMREQTVADHGYDDWILPDRAVGKMLYEQRDSGKLKGTLDKSSFRNSYECLWLSELYYNDYAYGQWFDDGLQDYGYPAVCIPGMTGKSLCPRHGRHRA